MTRKFLHPFFTLFLIVLSALNLSGQSGNCGLETGNCGGSAIINTFGTGTSTNNYFDYPAPFSNWFSSAIQQYLYTASELTAAGMVAGKIDEIDFNVTAISAGGISTFHEFTVKIGCDTFTSFDSVTPIFAQGLTTVFPSTTFTIATGWNTITFPSGYRWDGVSNLIVQICNSEGPPFSNYTFNAKTSLTATGNFSSIVCMSDASDQCPGPTDYTMVFRKHPNIRFHYCTSSVGVSSNSKISGFTIFPNPAEDRLTVSTDKITMQNIRIFNTLGACVLNLKDIGSSSTIDISRFAKGIYFIEAVIGQSLVRKKFVKE